MATHYPDLPPGDFAVTPNRPDLTAVIWRLIELKDFLDDQTALTHLGAALKRLHVLRDDRLIRGR
jgi:hypothetical protein